MVGVQHVEVIPGAQQETTSLLVQQQRVGVEAVGGTQEQGDAASLQQLCRTQIKRLLAAFARVRFGFQKKKKNLADTDAVYEKYYNQITLLYLARAKTCSVFLHLHSKTSLGLSPKKEKYKN